MDDSKGNLIPITDAQFNKQIVEKKPMVFKTGEILDIRGSRFRIERIVKNKMILKLLPQLKSNNKL